MIAVIHRGEKFKEMLEQFQQKRAEFIAQEIRCFDAETLFCLLETIRGKGAFYGAQRSPFCFRTAAFRSQRPPIF